MPVTSISPSASQTKDLAAVAALGAETLGRVCQAIDGNKITIKASKLREVIGSQIGPDNAKLLIRVLLGLSLTARRSNSSTSEVLDGLARSLSTKWDRDELERFNQSLPLFNRLLSSKSIYYMAKATDLATDFEHLCVTARIITNIRPVFDEDREEIVGSTVTQTLRIDYMTHSGDTLDISIMLDESDLGIFEKECGKARKKASVIRTKIEQQWGVETIISGEVME